MKSTTSIVSKIHRCLIKKSGLLAIILVLCMASCQQSPKDRISWSPDMANSLDDLQKGFKKPAVDFSTTPFWVWNDKVTKEKIDIQLQDFKSQGISMVFIHPRPGLITEYLSREWFELVRYAIDQAKVLNMKVWLYDENSFPSGFAGGHVPAATFSTSDPIAGLELTKLDVLSEKDTSNYFIIIKQVGNTFANITNSKKKYYGQPGSYYAFSKWYYPKGDGWYGGFSYVDLLAYGITEKFIKITMDGYEEYFGDELGKTVPGIFTDEPNINTTGGSPWVIRYTPVLFNRFEKKYGYQLETYLPCLYEEVGDWKNVRNDYHAFLLEMFIERWSKPWNKYTDEKNLKWTGHYWEHGWPNPKHGGDNMAMYAYHQYPGIDMLFNTNERADQFGNIRAVKELSSVSNQLDKARALSETYGGAGWELTFNDMKRLGDWEYALGVNFMVQHLSYMTIKGARKRDFPQSMSYHAPYWKHYKVLNDYFSRLSFSLSAGKQINRFLVLEPTTTAWMYFSPLDESISEAKNATLAEMKSGFDDLLRKLEKHQIEYDLGSESIVKDHGSVDEGKLVVGSRAYELVVLPPGFENLMDSTYKLLLAYLQQGGNVLSLNGVPNRLDGNMSKSMMAQLGKFTNQWINVDDLSDDAISSLISSGDFKAFEAENWGGNVFHQRRVLKDGQLYFFVNYDKEQGANIRFSGKGKSIIEFDLMSGNYYNLDVTEKEEMMELSFNLPPSGSKLLFFAEKRVNGEQKPDTNPGSPQEIITSKTVVKRIKPNTLPLDYCDLSINSKTFKDIYFYNAADTIFKTYLHEIYGFNYNPWSNAIQYRSRILDKNVFDSTTGFEVAFHFKIEEGFIPDSLFAVVESPALYLVKINGQSVEPIPDTWWLDRDFGVYDVQTYLRPNVNTLELVARPMDILAEVEPVYLYGDFELGGSDGRVLAKGNSLQLGSWREQQMPYYPDGVSYSKTFQKPSQNQAKVILKKWAGTVAQVQVNGQSAGIIAWPPYELDISLHLKEGQNQVEVIVTGSLKNLLGPHHNQPKRGLVTPWSFFYAPEHQPAVSEYDLIDYGLLEDFEVAGN